MGQVVHGRGTTTEAVRRAIQHSHVWTALADQGLSAMARSSRVRSWPPVLVTGPRWP